MASDPQGSPQVGKFVSRRAVAVNTATPFLLPNSQVSPDMSELCHALLLPYSWLGAELFPLLHMRLRHISSPCKAGWGLSYTPLPLCGQIRGQKCLLLPYRVGYCWAKSPALTRLDDVELLPTLYNPTPCSCLGPHYTFLWALDHDQQSYLACGLTSHCSFSLPGEKVEHHWCITLQPAPLPPPIL